MAYGTIQAYRTSGSGQAHFGFLRRPGVRAHHLHRDHRAAAQPGRGGRVHRGLQAGSASRTGTTRPGPPTTPPTRCPRPRRAEGAEGRRAREAEPAAEGKAPRVPAVHGRWAWPRRRRLSPRRRVVLRRRLPRRLRSRMTRRSCSRSRAHSRVGTGPESVRCDDGDQEAPYRIAAGATLDPGPCGASGRVTGESPAARAGDGAAAVIAYRRVRDRREITRMGNFVPWRNRTGAGDRHISWLGRRTARAARRDRK